MKSVVILGAGIAGLSAGIFAQKSGFNVTILERHSIAGGICTAWKRGGYLFEGGMHWLAGSNTHDPLNQLWRSIGAVDDGVAIHYNEPFMEFDHNGTPVKLCRDVDATEQQLLTLSPADEKEIKEFCNNIRKAQRGQEINPEYYTISREDYAKRFSYEGIRELIRSIPGEEQGIMMLFFTMVSLANGDGGFPDGGSLPFVKRIVKTFTSLGGKIQYNTSVDKIVIENGKATGVVSCDKHFPADAVIVASDTMSSDQLFDTPPQAIWLEEMRSITGPTMVTFVSLGINADLKKYPERPIFKLRNPIRLDNLTYKYLSVCNYAADPNYSPNGKTAMTIQLPGDTYDFWKNAKKEHRYNEEKQKISQQVIAAISIQFPEAAGKIEVCDIATPLTYEHYCGNWKGSWMTEMKSDMRKEPYPPAIEGLGGVYFAGQRMMPPGGLPTALITGQIAVQQLCQDTDTAFIDDSP
jgi:phytoene dehydrogenase-like protein